MSTMNAILFITLMILTPLLGGTMTAKYSEEHEQYLNIRTDAGPNKMKLWDTLKIVKKIFFDKNSRAPEGKLPEVRPDFVSFLIPAEQTKFIWFGHSTLLLNVDGETVLIDPVFSGSASPFSFLVKRFQPPVVELTELPHIDVIVISHDHYDHLDEISIKFFKDKTTEFIVPTGVGEHLINWGIPKERIFERSWGESVERSGIKFTATPAQHFSGRGLFDRNKTLWASWIIQGQKEKIFYSGDSGYAAHFKNIGEEYGPFDLAFLENGQYNVRWPDVHMQPEETLKAMVDIKAKTFVPVHWGMFDLSLHHWAEPIKRSYRIAQSWNIPIITPKIGEVIENRNYMNVQWWETVNQEQTISEPSNATPEFSIK